MTRIGQKTEELITLFLLPLILTVAGCATPGIDKPEASSAARPFPWFLPDAVNMNHRALVTIHGRQFAWNGNLTGNRNDGLRLVITDTIGLIADLTLDRNGTVTIGRLNPYFKEEWVRRYVARDLEAIFLPFVRSPGPGILVDDGRMNLVTQLQDSRETVRYIFSSDGNRLETCEVMQGTRQVCSMVCSHHVPLQGSTRLLPTQFKISGEGYEVNLRILGNDGKTQP